MKTALKLALEALEKHGDAYLGHSAEYQFAITKVKEALAQPEQEPVAMRHSFNGHGYKYTDIGFGNGWVDWTKHNFKDAEPLYTTPPQRKPMTDEQRLIEMVDAAMVATRDIVPRITRSQCRLIIEAAHGIKE